MSSRLSGITKGGWHPKGKDGGKESWRGDFKGISQISKLTGKGKGPEKEDPREHSSAPLSTLKDPTAFGPPPKHAHYYGAEAAAATARPAPNAPRAPASTSGWGAPVPVPEHHRSSLETAEEEEKPAAPPIPYRANTTGINPATLPKPPTRRDVPVESPLVAAAPPPTKPKPPPRLPPRQNSHPDVNAPSPPPAYTAAPSESSQPLEGELNTAATSRLGQSGISVPGFGIGGGGGAGSSKSPPPRQPAAAAAGSDTRSELANRFSKLSKLSSPASATSGVGGTTWAQKQAALTTASNFKKDPSSVSLSDARSTAGTANNFRERHGEQVASGWSKANAVNQKYGVAERARGIGMGGQTSSTGQADGGGAASPPASAPSSASTTEQQTGTAGMPGAIGKKAPPPKPLPKKQGLSAVAATGASSAAAGGEAGGPPPPIPLSSKPR